MQINKIAAAVFVSSLILFGCQQSEVELAQDNTANEKVTSVKSNVNNDAQLNSKPTEAVTDTSNK